MSVFKICRTCSRVGMIAEANQNCDTTDHPSPDSTKAETQPLVNGRAGKLDPASHVIANLHCCCFHLSISTAMTVRPLTDPNSAKTAGGATFLSLAHRQMVLVAHNLLMTERPEHESVLS